MASPFDLNASLSSSVSSGVQGGDAQFGDFLIGSSKSDFPVWLIVLLAAFALLFLTLKKR